MYFILISFLFQKEYLKNDLSPPHIVRFISDIFCSQYPVFLHNDQGM